MNDFLIFVDELVRVFPVHVEIYYSKLMDWCITVTKRGCAADYPESQHAGDDAILVREQGSDMQLIFAKAHVELKQWLIKNNCGY